MLGGKLKQENKILREQLEHLSKQLLDANTSLTAYHNVYGGLPTVAAERAAQASSSTEEEKISCVPAAVAAEVSALKEENAELLRRLDRERTATSRLRAEIEELRDAVERGSPSRSVPDSPEWSCGTSRACFLCLPCVDALNDCTRISNDKFDSQMDLLRHLLLFWVGW